MPAKAVSEMCQTPRSTESPFSITLLYAQTPGCLSPAVNCIISPAVRCVGVWECSSTSPSPVVYGQAIPSASKHCLLRLESAGLGEGAPENWMGKLNRHRFVSAQSAIKGISLAKSHSLPKSEPVQFNCLRVLRGTHLFLSVLWSQVSTRGKEGTEWQGRENNG